MHFLSIFVSLAFLGSAIAADPAVTIVENVNAKLKSMAGHISQLNEKSNQAAAEHFTMASKDILDALNAGISQASTVPAATDAAGASKALKDYSAGANAAINLLITKKDMAAKHNYVSIIGGGLKILGDSASKFNAAIAPKLAVAGNIVTEATSGAVGAISKGLATFPA
jgi:hypothetical protein